MNNLKVYVRNDLKMRKGKMAAQSAHAAMKLFFEVMHKIDNKMILSGHSLVEMESFLLNPVVSIIMVKDEDELNTILDKNTPFSIITDSGRTEFHGVPTVTCAAQGLFSKCDVIEFEVKHNYGKDIKAKQLFVFNKDVPLSKEVACKEAVISCLKQLYSLMHVDKNGNRYFDLCEKSPLIDWIMSAFAKIVVSTKTTEELIQLKKKLLNANFHVEHTNNNDNHCLCISPQYPQDIDVITSSLSLI